MADPSTPQDHRSQAVRSPAKRSVWLLLAHAPSLLAATALFALMLMTFTDVVLRSVANDPMRMATEMTRIFMAIIVFASLPIVTWRGEHITVDLLDGFFSRLGGRIRDIAIDLVSGIVLLWPGYRVWELAGRAMEYGDRTEYLRIPQFYIAYFIAVATLITAGILIIRAMVRLFTADRLDQAPPA